MKRENLNKKALIVLVLPFLILMACGGGREAGAFDDPDSLYNLVQEREFAVENQWANPLSGNRINLIGNPNYIRFKGDSVKVYLPYFGVRHSGGGYGSEGGIKFEGIPEDFSIRENEKSRIITFEGDNGSEDLDFRITVFPNGRTDTSVNSSERQAITYQGQVKRLPEEFF